MEAIVQEATGSVVMSMHHDISTKSGEEVLLFTLIEAPHVQDTKKQSSV
jgi:uncharacterized protein YbcI